MATAEETFLKYKQKVEKDATNDGTSTDRGRFCSIFNESQNKYQEFHLKQRKSDDARYIQNFLVLDKKIPYSSHSYDKYYFDQPENYFDLSDVKGLASNGKCSDVKIYLYEATTENVSELLQDPDSQPSFKWRESFYTITSNSVAVYTDNTFTMDNILLSYYRYPNQISLVNPNDPESEFNETIQIEWDDKALDRIISMCAGEFDINQSDPRFQLQDLRANK